MHQQDSKKFVAKICKTTQSELIAKLWDPGLSGALLNSVSSAFNSEQEGRVTAVVAKAKYHTVTKNQAKQKFEHSARSHPSDAVIQVLLDSGSDGDLMFHEEGMPMHFPYLTRQVPNSWHTLNGSFLTKGRSKVSLKIFEYSNSKEFLITPDVVEYDTYKMTKPAYDLILGCKTMKELGIVLDFRTKEITIDEIIFPIRNINSLTMSKMERASSVNNNIAHKAYSMHKATQQVVPILDAKYEKADLQSVVSTNCTHQVSKIKISYWNYSQRLRNFLMEH